MFPEDGFSRVYLAISKSVDTVSGLQFTMMVSVAALADGEQAVRSNNRLMPLADAVGAAAQNNDLLLSDRTDSFCMGISAASLMFLRAVQSGIEVRRACRQIPRCRCPPFYKPWSANGFASFVNFSLAGSRMMRDICSSLKPSSFGPGEQSSIGRNVVVLCDGFFHSQIFCIWYMNQRSIMVFRRCVSRWRRPSVRL